VVYYAKWFFRMVKNLDRSFFRFVTMHVFDRQTDRESDGQTEFSWLDHVCIPYSVVKSNSHCARTMVWNAPATFSQQLVAEIIRSKALGKQIRPILRPNEYSWQYHSIY